MKLLILTQKVDKDDPVLGFFHRWIEEFSKHYERVTVICLGKGGYSLPENVRVLSLGKEEGASRLEYVSRFYRYVWQERNHYDAVFVHMNQEYVILGWKFWKLWGKKIYMWRNHKQGSILTRLAVLVSNKVFYTSPSSYTARFKKAVRMPVGIDTDFFKPDPGAQRLPGSILFLGRIAPVKRVMEFIEWLKSQDFSQATIAGGALPKDKPYEEEVRNKVLEYGLADKVRFVGSVTQNEALKLYQTHETYVNFTPAGSLDKTIFEAKVCGMKVVVHNSDYQTISGEDHSLDNLMKKLENEMK